MGNADYEKKIQQELATYERRIDIHEIRDLSISDFLKFDRHTVPPRIQAGLDLVGVV